MIDSSFDFTAVQAAIEKLNQRGYQQQMLIQTLIELSAYLPEFPEALKIKDNEVEGCETSTWLFKSEQGIQASSQSRIMQGLLIILIHQYFNPEHPPLKVKQLSASKRLAWERLQKAI